MGFERGSDMAGWLYFAIMLPGRATLSVLVRPPVGRYIAVGLEVSGAFAVT
jgi:hypothetical protein